MTDRYHALTVVLENNIREDDAQPLIIAIKMLRGVLSVEPHLSNIDVHVAEDRARHKLISEMWKILSN